ncbi:LysR family transcriptional regulator [Solirubrobacter sp. CPCC 204708]|uniref:LysR family transcriptional regulator n=1 Tax=Solirubrobacter deserti TaxID=2282478 RepID=A0ABT4RQH3_9ACTN|nr:LysR substrate-binding domain-containing protein [Solirubrobacter deserti]MBE2316647.1 LysR family transcriptional regulator [Solirubrobacter deserti]MDA0140545.1 LysR family transcriptional regulator [Solirubrobacter deserti]
MPELSQLRTFTAVAEALSFTRAAEELGLSQQAASKAVRALEDELGVVLLERTTREVRLTPAGTTLLASARDLLARAEVAFAEVRDVEAGLSGTIRIGVSPAIGLTDRTDAARALRTSSSRVAVAFHEVRPAQLRALLRAGELEVALTRARGLDEDAISTHELRPSTVVCCLPASHRLAKQDAVSVAALVGERLLVPSPPGTPFTDLLLARVPGAIPVEARVTGTGVILSELVAEDAVYLMPEGTGVPPGVVARPIAGGLTLPLFVLWAAGRPSPAARRLIAVLGVPGAG